jgi:hypothetical protein
MLAGGAPAVDRFLSFKVLFKAAYLGLLDRGFGSAGNVLNDNRFPTKSCVFCVKGGRRLWPSISPFEVSSCEGCLSGISSSFISKPLSDEDLELVGLGRENSYISRMQQQQRATHLVVEAQNCDGDLVRILSCE